VIVRCAKLEGVLIGWLMHDSGPATNRGNRCLSRVDVLFDNYGLGSLQGGMPRT